MPERRRHDAKKVGFAALGGYVFLILLFGWLVLRMGTFESKPFTIFSMIAFCLVFVGAVAYAFCALVSWRRLHALLRCLRVQAMAERFAKLHPAVGTMFSYPIVSSSHVKTLGALEFAACQAIVESGPERTSQGIWSAAKAALDVATQRLKSQNDVLANRPDAETAATSDPCVRVAPHWDAFDALGKAVANEMAVLQAPQAQPMSAAKMEILAELDGTRLTKPVKVGPGKVDLYQDFLAVRAAAYISRACLSVRLELASTMALSVSLVVALASYPFSPQESLNIVATAVAVGAAMVSFSVLLMANKNSTMSLLAGTTPGKVNWDFAFVTRSLTLVAIPVLTLLANQPWLGGERGSLITKAVRVFLGLVE